MTGEEVGEVHGANRPLDPNFKPKHQLKVTKCDREIFLNKDTQKTYIEIAN